MTPLSFGFNVSMLGPYIASALSSLLPYALIALGLIIGAAILMFGFKLLKQMKKSINCVPDKIDNKLDKVNNKLEGIDITNKYGDNLSINNKGKGMHFISGRSECISCGTMFVDLGNRSRNICKQCKAEAIK